MCNVICICFYLNINIFGKFNFSPLRIKKTKKIQTIAKTWNVDITILNLKLCLIAIMIIIVMVKFISFHYFDD